MRHIAITVLTVASLLPTLASAKAVKITCKYCKVTQCDDLATKYGNGSFEKKKDKGGCSFIVAKERNKAPAVKEVKRINRNGQAVDDLTPDKPKIQGPKVPKIKLPDIKIKGPKAPKIKLPF